MTIFIDEIFDTLPAWDRGDGVAEGRQPAISPPGLQWFDPGSGGGSALASGGGLATTGGSELYLNLGPNTGTYRPDKTDHYNIVALGGPEQVLITLKFMLHEASGALMRFYVEYNNLAAGLWLDWTGPALLAVRGSESTGITLADDTEYTFLAVLANGLQSYRIVAPDGVDIVADAAWCLADYPATGASGFALGNLLTSTGITVTRFTIEGIDVPDGATALDTTVAKFANTVAFFGAAVHGELLGFDHFNAGTIEPLDGWGGTSGVIAQAAADPAWALRSGFDGVSTTSTGFGLLAGENASGTPDGEYLLGDPATDHTEDCGAAQVTFNLVTPTAPAASRDLLIELDFGGTAFSLVLGSDPADTATDPLSRRLTLGGAAPVLVAMEADAQYMGILMVRSGAQELHFMDQVFTSDDTISPGLRTLALSLGAGNAMSLLSVQATYPIGSTAHGYASLTLPSVQAAGEQLPGTRVNSVLSLPSAGMAATALMGASGGGVLRLPSASATAGGFAGPVGNSAAVLPSLAISATGFVTILGNSGLALPAPDLYMVGHDSTGERSVRLSMPSLTLRANGGANARLTLPAPALGIAATSTGWGNALITAPSAALSADGKVAGTASAEISLPMVAITGRSGVVCSITLTGKASLSASGATGAIGGATISLPLFEMIAVGTAQNHGSAALVLPALQMGATARARLVLPGCQLRAIGTAVVAASYEAYSINLSHRDPEANDEVTRYTNFPFTHIVRYQGSYFGVAGDGLYLLEGTTDDGVAIHYALKTGTDDFDVPQLKTVAAAYFGGRLGPSATVTLHAGETGAESYSYTTPRGQAAQSHREKFGRGVKSRYFALGLAGEDALALDSIELEINKMKRRV